MTTIKYTREELEQDLARLIKDWDARHELPNVTKESAPRKPRRVWLGSMADITDDYPYHNKPLPEALHDATPAHTLRTTNSQT